MGIEENYGITVKKPISVWTRDLNISPKTFFINLSKATINGVKGDFDDCAENLLDSVADIKNEEKIGQLAWVLVFQSLQNSIAELIKECLDLLNIDPMLNLISVEKDLKEALDETFKAEFVITSDFLDSPERLEILSVFSILLEQYCRTFGASSIDAKSIASKLPNKFSLSIYKLWIDSSDKFQGLVDVLQSPISKSNNEHRKWQIYHQSLNVAVDKRIFKESFGLKDIYIKPRAYYKAPLKNDIVKSENKAKNTLKHVIDLHAYLESWILKQDTSDNLKLISGGPGSGKSSFSKVFSSEIAKKTGFNVLLIQLHLLDMSKDLNTAIQSYCDEYKALYKLDVFASNKLIIIFDGLDEISMQGKIGANVSINFINELKRKSEFFSQDNKNIKLIVTGRDLAIQSCENIVKEVKKYINIVPYFIPQNSYPIISEEYYDPENLLLIDQRNIWWKKFSALKGLEWNCLPPEINNDELEPISSQPLLGYLLALSYLRGQIDFSEGPNLNSIYHDLLESVYDRQYASDDGHNSKTHSTIEMLSKEDFDLLMQEVALAVWHSNGTTATEKYIYDHLRFNELEYLLEQFQNDSGNGVSSLLLSFYFRKHGQTDQGESTFEFTHKSFGEYLTAKKLVNLIIDLSDAYIEKKQNYRKGKKLDDIIYEWVKATGKSTFEIYLFSFVRNEFENLNLSKNRLNEIYNCLTIMINDSIQNNFALEKFPELTFKQMISYSENANLALMALHSACTRVLFDDEEKDYEEKLRPKTLEIESWLDKNMINDKFNAHLEYMDFSELEIHFKNFNEANISYSQFCISEVGNCSFNEASAEGVDLSFCNIFTTNFLGANLFVSNFTSSNIIDVDFSNADMTAASLLEANLSEVKFVNTRLEHANLSRASFENSDLSEANLAEAELTNATFINTNLSKANFKEASLQGCNFSGANLQGADFNCANLSNANLSNANLSNAVLSNATLTGAKIKGCDFTGVDMTDVDLTGSIK